MMTTTVSLFASAWLCAAVLSEPACELTLTVSSAEIMRNDVVLARVVAENRGTPVLSFRQGFGGATGIVQFEIRRDDGPWTHIPCHFCGRLGSPNGEQKLLPSTSFCSYERIVGKGDTFTWTESGEFELRAVATGIGFRVESKPVRIRVTDETALERLPEGVSSYDLGTMLGVSSTMLSPLKFLKLEGLNENSELAKNLDRNKVYSDWVKAEAKNRPALYARVLQVIAVSDKVVSERFILAVAQQQIKEGKLAEARILLKDLEHPSKLSQFLGREIERRMQSSPQPTN